MRSIKLFVSVLMVLTTASVQTEPVEITPPTGWLGIGLTCQTDAETHQSFLLIHGTAPVGPASEADLESGDIILEVDDTAVSCRQQLDALTLFRHLEAGQRVTLVVLRSGEQRNIHLEAIEMPGDLEAMWIEQYRRLKSADGDPLSN